MFPQLIELLTALEKRLDPAKDDSIEELHRKCLVYDAVPRPPLVMNYPVPPEALFEPLPHGHIYRNPEYMLHNQLVSAFDASIAYRDEVSDDLSITIRPNFGTVLIASILGGRIEQVDDHWPWVRHFETDAEYFRIFEADVNSPSAGWIPRVVECYEYYHEILADYPTLRACTKIVMPDLQGPLDILEQLRGADLFTDFYTDPRLLEDGIDLAARALLSTYRLLEPLTADRPAGFCHQHATMIAGNILLRNDSAVMISPEMYRDYVLPSDASLLEEIGGGGIHSCGRIEHDFDHFFSIPTLRCIDLGQPEMNDIDSLYRKAAARKVALIRIRVSEEEITSGSVRRRFPTGVSLVHAAESVDEAKRIMGAYKNAGESA